MRLLVRIVKHVKPFAKMPVNQLVRPAKADVNQHVTLAKDATDVKLAAKFPAK